MFGEQALMDRTCSKLHSFASVLMAVLNIENIQDPLTGNDADVR